MLKPRYWLLIVFSVKLLNMISIYVASRKSGHEKGTQRAQSRRAGGKEFKAGTGGGSQRCACSIKTHVQNFQRFIWPLKFCLSVSY